MMLLKAILIVLVAAIAAAGLSAVPFVARAQTISPEVQRLEELVAVVNRGDAAAMRAYLQANSGNMMLLPLLHELYRLSTGLEVVRITTIGAQQIQPQLVGYTVAILRNKATGDEQALAIVVEPQPPHRITGLPILHPSLASYRRSAPI